jgi:hypothetical protein
MRARDINMPSDGDSRQTDQGKSKKGATAKLRPWEVSNQDRYSSTSDQKGKAPASDELQDLHSRNVVKDSRPPREKEAKLMLEAEPENPVSAWKQELKQESPWVSMRLKEETIDAIAEFGVRKQQEAAMIREWEVGMAIEDDLNQKIAELPPKLQKRLFKYWATGTDEPDTWYSQLYNDIRNACQSVWESLVKKSDTSNSPLRDNEQQTVSSIHSPSEWFSPRNSPLRDNEQQTVSSMQSELDRLRETSFVQAEVLDSRSNNQQSSTSLQEIAATNREKDPVSSGSKDLNTRSSVRDSNQDRKQARRFKRISWSGLTKTCRSAKDTQVIEPTHVPKQKPQRREARKSTQAEPS